MIKTFKQKGLERFFSKDSTSGIQAKHARKIADQFAFLHAAQKIDDIDKPGYKLHELKGKLEDRWAISVSGNWRIVFSCKDGDAYIVNYKDYH